jgi:hypothetical protein
MRFIGLDVRDPPFGALFVGVWASLPGRTEWDDLRAEARSPAISAGVISHDGWQLHIAVLSAATRPDPMASRSCRLPYRL